MRDESVMHRPLTTTNNSFKMPNTFGKPHCGIAFLFELQATDAQIP